jgi:hypothetical protein
MTDLTIAERTDLAREAEALIAEAIENLKQAIAGLGTEGHHEAYLLYRLECAIGAGSWMSSDPTVADLIRDIERHEPPPDRACAGCGALVDEPGALCPDCWAEYRRE